uniref:Uncharacterized protein n=1 Tax=Cucumis melo TaxID=3656 RepID=A0A9I9EFB4_CUCME
MFGGRDFGRRVIITLPILSLSSSQSVFPLFLSSQSLFKSPITVPSFLPSPNVIPPQPSLSPVILLGLHRFLLHQFHLSPSLSSSILAARTSPCCSVFPLLLKLTLFARASHLLISVECYICSGSGGFEQGRDGVRLLDLCVWVNSIHSFLCVAMYTFNIPFLHGMLLLSMPEMIIEFVLY